MTSSKYNIEFLHKGKRYVYNTKNGGLIEIESPLNQLLNSSYADYLKNSGYFVIDREREILDLIDKSNYVLSQKSESIDITLMLTLKCNFRCAYCYQDRVNKELNDNDVYRFIQEIEKIVDLGVKTINLHYFGGEPLLMKKTIQYIDNKLKEISFNLNINYNSYLTTNGSMLDKGTLETINFKKIQLTFDGNEQFHNKFKISNNFDYYGLLRRIGEIMVFSNSKLNIRFNICKENKDTFPEVLRDIFRNEKIDISRLSFRFNPMRNFKSNTVFSELSIAEFSEIDWKLRKLLRNYGIKLQLPKAVLVPCAFPSKLGVCLGPDLQTYFCSSSNQVIDNKIDLACYINGPRLNFKLPELCMNCNVLPLCMNNCKLFKNPEDACISEKFVLLDMLKDYIDNPEAWT